MLLTRRAVTALALAALATSVVCARGAIVAHADTVQPVSCVTATTWSFSPPLSSAFQSGTVTASYTGNCGTAGATLNNAPVPSLYQGGSVNEGAYVPVYTVVYSYQGNCQSASLSYDNGFGSGTLTEGSVIDLLDSGPTYTIAESGALIPPAPASPFCSVASSSGLTVETGSFIQLTL